jgi:hypothetical protein
VRKKVTEVRNSRLWSYIKEMKELTRITAPLLNGKVSQVLYGY